MIGSKSIVAVTLIASLYLLSGVAVAVSGQNTTPRVVLTIEALKEYVSPLLCGDEEVDYIVPKGLDPHIYELKASDLDKLKKANVIISSGHAGFELEIREKVSENEFRALYIDVMDTPEMTLLKIPVYNSTNYHLPISDPYNYIRFAWYFAEKMSKSYPERAECYYRKTGSVVVEITRLIESYGHRFNYTAVVSSPRLQYYVSWLGIEAKYSLNPEETIEPSASLLEKIENDMKAGLINLVVIAGTGGSAEEYLKSKAQQYGIHVIELQLPRDKDILSRLTTVAYSVASSNGGEVITNTSQPSQVAHWDTMRIIALSVAIFLTGIVVGLLVSKHGV